MLRGSVSSGSIKAWSSCVVFGIDCCRRFVKFLRYDPTALTHRLWLLQCRILSVNHSVFVESKWDECLAAFDCDGLLHLWQVFGILRDPENKYKPEEMTCLTLQTIESYQVPSLSQRHEVVWSRMKEKFLLINVFEPQLHLLCSWPRWVKDRWWEWSNSNSFVKIFETWWIWLWARWTIISLLLGDGQFQRPDLGLNWFDTCTLRLASLSLLVMDQCKWGKPNPFRTPHLSSDQHPGDFVFWRYFPHLPTI